MLIDDFLDVYPMESWFKESLRHATVFKIHNVADNVLEKRLADTDFDVFDDLAPPFPNMWLEWTHHDRWGFAPSYQNIPDKFRAAVLIRSFDLKDEPAPAWNVPEARWMSCAYVFFETIPLREGIVSSLGLVYLVSPEGRPLKEHGFRYCPSPLGPYVEPTEDEMIGSEGFINFLAVPFMAVSMMHCKNIGIEKGPPHPPRLQGARRRRLKLPLLRFHTLTINGMGKENASTSNGGRCGSPTPFHRVRGHFKDFNERGLFGVLKGRYWWDRHARGSRSSGMVLKDYKLQVRPAARGSHGG